MQENDTFECIYCLFFSYMINLLHISYKIFLSTDKKTHIVLKCVRRLPALAECWSSWPRVLPLPDSSGPRLGPCSWSETGSDASRGPSGRWFSLWSRCWQPVFTVCLWASGNVESHTVGGALALCCVVFSWRASLTWLQLHCPWHGLRGWAGATAPALWMGFFFYRIGQKYNKVYKVYLFLKTKV